jgi:glutamate synthase (NADPH/NADH) small chain
MEQSRLRELEEQCIQDCAPPCTALCPVHVDIRQLASAVSQGDFSGGMRIIRKAVPFPEIIARTCDQPCQTRCNRQTLGGAIHIADLELACVQYAAAPFSKSPALPKKNARIAVIGGGLSGLTAAFELSRKGYRVTLFEQQNRLGGSLWNFPPHRLPPEVIERETALLAQSGVDIRLGQRVERAQKTLEEFEAVYLGCGRYDPALFSLQTNAAGVLQANPDTFQTSQLKVFAGGSLLHPPSPVVSISDGRRAAISIDRFLQNVSLAASRVNEGPYETRLFTDISGAASINAVIPETIDAGYTQEEAQQEAARCLQCECMECVKICEYLKHYGKYPKLYVREIYNNLSIIKRARTANRFINSCTLCGLCAEVCPTGLNMGIVNRETRQTMTATSKMPPSAHDFALRDIAFSNSEKFALALTPRGSDACSYAFFPGCQLAASSPEYIPQIFQSLQSAIPDVGLLLRCCGAPADWAGETDLFHQASTQLRAQWQTLGQPILILACSSCNQMIRQSLPEIETISLWEIYQQHQLYPTEISLQDKSFVIHDPCTARHAEAWQEAARHILAQMGVPFHELALSRRLTSCCGYGGVAWLANPELVGNIIRRRIAEDNADYLTYCAMCRDLFANEGKPTLHLLDLIYGNDLARLARRKGPDYSQRHENRARVRRTMFKLLSGEDDPKMETFEKYAIILSPEMRAQIEARLILVEDIQKVIEHAETSGERFINQENGHILAYFKPNVVTYWVEYTPSGNAYQIHDAYSHRMEFEGDASL